MLLHSFSRRPLFIQLFRKKVLFAFIHSLRLTMGSPFRFAAASPSSIPRKRRSLALNQDNCNVPTAHTSGFTHLNQRQSDSEGVDNIPRHLPDAAFLPAAQTSQTHIDIEYWNSDDFPGSNSHGDSAPAFAASLQTRRRQSSDNGNSHSAGKDCLPS